MHLPGMNMHIPQAMIPAMTGVASHMLKKQVADLGVPEIPDFLEQIVAAGGHLLACRLSTGLNKLRQIDLRDDVEGIISASDFMELTDGAQLLFT